MADSLVWLEVWVDGKTDIFFTYVLVLKSLDSGTFQLFDPHQNKTIEVFKTYEAATNWLNEEEYDLVETRWSSVER